MAEGQGEEVMPGVPTCASPPHVAKDRANHLLQQRGPIPVAEVVLDHHYSIGGAASAAAEGGTHSPSISVCSDESSNSSYYSDAASRAGDCVTAPRDDLVDILSLSEDVGGDNEALPTDAEVSKYTFFQRLHHYMEGEKIRHSNRKAVGMALLVEVGTMV